MELLDFIAKLVNSNSNSEEQKYWRVIVKCFLLDGLEEERLENLPYYYKQFYGASSPFNGKLLHLLQQPEFSAICIVITQQSEEYTQPSEFLLRVLCGQLNDADAKELKSNSSNNNNCPLNNVFGDDHVSQNNRDVPFEQKQIEDPDQLNEARFGRFALEELSCPICFEILTEAVEGNCCKNVFCQLCIEQNGRKCPNCRKVVNWTPNEPIRRLIAKRPVQCEYEGCNAWSTVSEIEQHRVKCEFKLKDLMIRCHKCQQRVPRKSLETHLRIACMKSNAPCRYCGSIFAKIDLRNHQTQTGELRPVSCARGCDVPDMTYKEYTTNHVNICPFELVRCTYAQCSISVQRGQLKDHVATCQFGATPCPNKGCDVDIPISDNSHQYKCPFKLVKCKYGCQEEMLKKNSKKHKGDCLARKITCLFGCGAVVPIREMPKHRQSCYLREVQCEKCQGFVTFNLLEAHKSAWCPKRVVLCKVCRMPATDNHAESRCPKRLVPCPQCTELVTVDSYNQHVSIMCPQRAVPCSRCGQVLTKRTVIEHEMNCRPEKKSECLDCQELVLTRSYVSHRLDLCPMRRLECQFCRADVPAASLVDHQATCPKRHISESGDDELSDQLLSSEYQGRFEGEHRETELILYRQCLTCQRKILSSQYEVHSATCVGQKDECIIC